MIEVNLHPEGRAEPRKRRRRLQLKLPDWEGFGGMAAIRGDPWRYVFFAALVLAPAAVLGMWYTQRAERSDLQQRLEAAAADSARLAELQTLSDSLIRRRQQLRERIQLIRGFDEDRFVWPHLMDEISRALPENTWITQISRRGSLPDVSVELQGMTTEPLLVTDFVRALQRQPHVGSVRIVRSQRRQVGGVNAHNFTLIASYERPPLGQVRTEPLIGGS